MYRLMLIDDDSEILQLNYKSFVERGFSVRCARSGGEGLAALAESGADCVLLDVMMPDIDGFEVCRRIRAVSSVPVIFITGRVSEDDKVEGLLTGADDYIEKPYSFRELEARVLACLRRAAAVPDGRISFPPLEIDVAGHNAFCEGENLYLSNQEYDLLHMLASSGGGLVTYEQIGVRLWGSFRQEDRRAIMMGVSRLRKKLECHPLAARMIETVWSKGYRFTGKRGGPGRD